MRISLLVLLLILTGCIHRTWFHLLDGHEEACARVGYCNEKSGMVVIGDVHCYTQDITTQNPIDNKDLVYADKTSCSYWLH